MFLQVIQGTVTGAADVTAQLQRWIEDVGPAAVGWLGSTAGITDAGEVVVIARFTSAEAAARNSDLPGQDGWWNEMAKLFTDTPTFLDCADPILYRGGGSGEARFVQVITGRTDEPDALRSLAVRGLDVLSRHRPDILGMSLAIAEDGRTAQIVYFTDEAKARANESAEPAPELAELIGRQGELIVDPRYLDLHNPVLQSPADTIPLPVLHEQALAAFGERVRQVAADQWSLPTPCDGWDVRELVSHVVGEVLWTRPLLDGLTIEEVGDRFDGDVLGEDPLARWAAASAEAAEAMALPGAMAATTHLSFGDTPGRDYAAQLVVEYAVHAWDLSRAIGADDTLDPVLVEACAALFDPLEAAFREAGAIGPPVDIPVDADAQTRLLARFGRTR